MKEKIISVTLLIIITLKILDLYVDFTEEVNFIHLAQEVSLIILSGAVFIFLVLDIKKNASSLSALKRELSDSKLRVHEISEELKSSKRDFFTAVNNQFAQWQLTNSESEIGLLLLKGLSLAEISMIRNTSEKTVRHHASSIYKKADCKGRHELAAIFFEELN